MKAKHFSGNQAQPQCVFAQERSTFWFSPRPLLAIGTRRSVLPPAQCALVVCRSLLELVTNSKRALLQGEGRWGLKRPCVQWPHHLTFLHVGRDPTRAHLRKGTKLASGSCVRESYTLLGKTSSSPMPVCSAKQRFLISPLAHCSP